MDYKVPSLFALQKWKCEALRPLPSWIGSYSFFLSFFCFSPSIYGSLFSFSFSSYTYFFFNFFLFVLLNFSHFFPLYFAFISFLLLLSNSSFAYLRFFLAESTSFSLSFSNFFLPYSSFLFSPSLYIFIFLFVRFFPVSLNKQVVVFICNTPSQFLVVFFFLFAWPFSSYSSFHSLFFLPLWLYLTISVFS